MGNNTIIISWNRDYQEINSASIQFRYHETLAGLSALTAWLRYLLMLGWLSNRMGTSVDDGKARGKDRTRLPVPYLPICRWSSQLFDLGVSSSAGVPVLMLNQPIIYSITVAWENRRNFPTPPLHGFPAKRRLRNKRRNSILMMPHHPDVGVPSHWPFMRCLCFWLLEGNIPHNTTNQKHYPDLGSDTSPVWNFCSRFSDVTCFADKPVQCCGREISAVFSLASIKVLLL